MTGRESRVGMNTIASVGDNGGSGTGINPTRGFTATYVDPGPGGDQCHLVDGDSGGGSAVQTGDGLALVGTHSLAGSSSAFFTTTYTIIDSFVPHYMDRLDAVMERGGYHVTRFNATTPDLSILLSGAQDPAIFVRG